MKGNFHPPERCGFGRWCAQWRSNGLYGCSEEEVSTRSSLTTYTASTITLCYILLTSFLFTIPFPQRSLLVRPTNSLDWSTCGFVHPSLYSKKENARWLPGNFTFWTENRNGTVKFSEGCSSFFSSATGNGTVNNPWNSRANSLTHGVLHDVMMWNTDNKDHKTMIDPLQWTRFISRAFSRPDQCLSWGIRVTNAILPYKSLSL